MQKEAEEQSQLTRREADCLRLLASGLLTSEVRAELNISPSTLNVHLASARRKLGVRTTMQAVLKFASDTGNPPNGDGPWPGNPSRHEDELSEAQIDLLDRLAASQTFTQAWQALHVYLNRFGIIALNLGVIADPMGRTEPGGYALHSSLPGEVMNFYYALGGPLKDPSFQYLSYEMKPVAHDLELSPEILAMGPPELIPFAECLIDRRLNRQLALPGRDSMTDAPYAGSVVFGECTAAEFRKSIATYADELQQGIDLFWDFVQSRAMLAQAANLTPREREALQLAARGFTVADMAGRLHVSHRSAEKFLSGARSKLGARNNAQAVYRAMVFRALASAPTGAIKR